MPELTQDQLHTLRHMLGINTPYDREPKPYRNYAAVTPGCDAKYLQLEAMGMVARFNPNIPSEYHYYRCTDAGKAAAMESHKTIRHSLAKRRCRSFLALRDYFPDLTFKEFLTSQEFEAIRAQA